MNKTLLVALVLLISQVAAGSVYGWGGVGCNPAQLRKYVLEQRLRRMRQSYYTYDFLSRQPTSLAEPTWRAIRDGEFDELPYIRPDVIGGTYNLDYYDHHPKNDSEGVPIGYGIQGMVGYMLGGFGALNRPGRIRPGYIYDEDHSITYINCEHNYCHFETQSLTTIPVAPGFNVNANLTLIGYFGFDADDRITIVWSHVPNMQDKNYVVEDDQAGGSLIGRTAYAQALCQKVQINCVGANQQYANFTECVTFMNSLPLRGFESAHRRNLNCNGIHNQLAADQPNAHCMHVGPTGGGQCADRNLPIPGKFDANGIAYGTNYEDIRMELLHSRVDKDIGNPDYEQCLDTLTLYL